MSAMDFVKNSHKPGEEIVTRLFNPGNCACLGQNDDQSHAVKKPDDHGFRDEVGDEPDPDYPGS